MNTFELTIQRKRDAGWPVVVEHSRPGGLPLRREGFLHLGEMWQEQLISETDPRAYGTLLGHALFRDAVRDAFVQARVESQGSLRVLLVVEEPQLKDLHWERLCAPIRLGGQWDHLALDQQTLFSLYLPSLTDRRFPPIGRRDLRALVLVANTPEGNRYGLHPFDAQATVASVETALGDIPHEVLANVQDAAGPPTLDELCARITAQPYTVLHIVAHGWFRSDDGETILYLLDEAGEIAPVTTTHLLERLDQLHGARGLPQLAFLSTCESAAPEAEREGALGGLAQRLVQELGMPAVVAMTQRVSIATAEALAASFYERLRDHGEADRALVEASAGLADRDDITVPALYSRLGGRPLYSDTLDRPLTDAEIDYGLSRVEELLPQRAPVLQPEFETLAKTLRGSLDADPQALAKTAREERAAALTEVNELCREVLELSFNALALGQDPPAYDARCPFLGLNPFRVEDRPFFFGRETLVRHLVDQLAEHPFLAVLGPSGSGKSSVVLAGLVPKLQDQEADFQMRYMTPGNDPVAQLAKALDGNPDTADPQAVLVVDQFEELFTLCTDEDKRRAFITHLLALAEAMRVVITMRADFWGDCAPHRDLTAVMQAHMENIPPMNTAELRSAMEQQARAVGLRFEADLSHTILDDVRGEPGAMPLLQHALLEMWKRRHGRWLRAEEYRALGGVQQAISRTADTIYAGLSSEERERMRDVFLRLTRLDEEAVPGEERRDTRRRVRFEELVPAGTDPVPAGKLVQELADARLVVTSVNGVTEAEEVEVAHEALIRYWSRLRGWLDEDRDLLRLREGIRQATQEWRTSPDEQRESLLVHRGARLEDIEALVQQGRLRLNEQEQRYIEACVELREAERAREEKQRKRELKAAQALAEEQRRRAEEQAQAAGRLRQRAIVLAVVALLAVVAALFAFYAKVTADQQRDLAESRLSAKLALVASPLANTLDLRLLLGAGAFQVRETPRARSALQMVMQSSPHLISFLHGHAGDVWSVAFSPDGQTLASGSKDGTIILWDMAARRPLGEPLRGHEASVRSLAFSPDGQTLASGGEDTAIILWDVTVRQQLGNPILGHEASVRSLAFSPDGKTLASGSRDGTVVLWNLMARRPLGEPLQGHEATVWSLAFSPDGRMLASGGEDDTIILWDITARESLGGPLRGHEATVWSVAFSPDGRTLASGDRDGTIILWDVGTRASRGSPIEVVEGSVTSVAFSPDGKALATAKRNGAITLVDVATGEWLGDLQGRKSPVWSIAFSPDSRTLASGHRDGAVILWDVTTRSSPRGDLESAGCDRAILSGDQTLVALAAPTPLGDRLRSNMGEVCGVAFSPDGHILASGIEDGTIILWDVDARLPLGNPLKRHTVPVLGMAFSSDGETLTSVSRDGTIIVWSVDIHQPIGNPHEIHVDEGGASSVAFGDDGRTVALGTWDGTIILWDVAKGQQLGSLKPHEDHSSVSSVTFSPDAQTLGSGYDDGTILLWNLAQRLPSVGPIQSQRGSVLSLAFSPDGRTFASGDSVGAVLWDAATGTPLVDPLEYDQESVKSVVFSHDGQVLASGSDGGTIILWDVATGKSRYRLPFGGWFWDLEYGVLSMAFSPNENLLASGNDDGAIILWDLDPESWPARACRRANRNLTQEEWNEFFGTETRYQCTCPDLPPGDGAPSNACTGTNNQ